MGAEIEGWRVCWLGGWGKNRLFFFVMLVRSQAKPLRGIKRGKPRARDTLNVYTFRIGNKTYALDPLALQRINDPTPEVAEDSPGKLLRRFQTEPSVPTCEP